MCEEFSESQAKIFDLSSILTQINTTQPRAQTNKTVASNRGSETSRRINVLSFITLTMFCNYCSSMCCTHFVDDYS